MEGDLMNMKRVSNSKIIGIFFLQLQVLHTLNLHGKHWRTHFNLLYAYKTNFPSPLLQRNCWLKAFPIFTWQCKILFKANVNWHLRQCKSVLFLNKTTKYLYLFSHSEIRNGVVVCFPLPKSKCVGGWWWKEFSRAE